MESRGFFQLLETLADNYLYLQINGCGKMESDTSIGIVKMTFSGFIRWKLEELIFYHDDLNKTSRAWKVKPSRGSGQGRRKKSRVRTKPDQMKSFHHGRHFHDYQFEKSPESTPYVIWIVDKCGPKDVCHIIIITEKDISPALKSPKPGQCSRTSVSQNLSR